MAIDKTIDLLIRELQDETPNSGGYYHFSKLEIPKENTGIRDRLIKYLQSNDAYKSLYVNDQGQFVKLIDDKDPKGLVLEAITDWQSALDGKLEYWSNHRTSLDVREKITDNYPHKLMEFKDAFRNFMDSMKIVKVYSVKGINTCLTFGGDHVNDDLLIETESDVFVLHFGWSS
ncbi:hypothetical protein WBG78_22960 [Chryseolinea sp. T2]|uniref:hypothetical protein n=1 Tax=Chryseolinea sp. T2 TaxID=3129255 RepID=UPI003077304A